MRKINYIIIDSDIESHDSKSIRRNVPNSGHHYCVNQQGLVINNVDISKPINLIEGPIYDLDKFNSCSIGIHYCGSLRSEAWLLEPETNCQAMMRQRKALIRLLVELRKHFTDAKILGISEIDGKAPNYKNIIVSDVINMLRKELSMNENNS